MSYSLFFILEGDDDERFFMKIINPLLKEKYPKIQIWKYAQEKSQRILRLLKSIQSMQADYVFVKDIDDYPCITTCKEQLVCRSNGAMKENKIIIIVKEIESWYLAGCDENCCRKLGIRENLHSTDNINKERFNHMIPKRMSRIEFMLKILESFNIEIAQQRNRTLEYFLDEWVK